MAGIATAQLPSAVGADALLTADSGGATVPRTPRPAHHPPPGRCCRDALERNEDEDEDTKALALALLLALPQAAESGLSHPSRLACTRPTRAAGGALLHV
jgi:hypothetical protein